MIPEKVEVQKCIDCSFWDTLSNEYPCSHCTHIASNMWQSMKLSIKNECDFNIYSKYDTGIDELLAELEEHYVGKCKKCSARKPECGTDLSISGYHNCLEFGLFVEKKG